jgi:glycosyltransferase involved in cell wall biosynthesis
MEMWHRYRLPFFLAERIGLRCYREIVVVNPADGARVRHCNPSANVQVIPNCIDLPPLDEGSPPGAGEHILYLGRIDLLVKGLDLLLAACERSGVTMPLVLAGSGTAGEERKLTRLLDTVRGDVRWVGYVADDRKRELLAASAFVAVPSRHESFGLAALEGMSYRKPVLHFDLPTLEWMAGDVRVPPFDVDAFAACMRDLAEDEQLRSRLGRVARAAAQRYGREETAGEYLTLVRRLLDVPAADARSERDPAWQ